MKFNSSGTRLYLEQGVRPDLQDPEVESWHGVVRIETADMAAGVALADWILSGPELVFANNLINGSTGEPTSARPRPDTDPYVRPDPEMISAGGGEFLNADECASIYADYASGMLLASSDLWQACISEDILVQGDGGSWESPDSYLFGTVVKRNWEIYRFYVSGGMDGTEQKIIRGSFPDTGR
jgi:hypothetical protein